MDFINHIPIWDNALKFAASQITNEELIILDWAGIGDANCHSRLIAETIYETKTKNICWLTPAIVADLYKDDTKFKVIPSFCCPFRNVEDQTLFNTILPVIDNLIKNNLQNKPIINISNNVCYHFYKNKTIPIYTDFFFEANKIKRNYNIKHTLQHNKKLDIKEKLIFFEYSSATFGILNINMVNQIINIIVNAGYKVVIPGHKNDPDFIHHDNVIDIRGLGLYDTFSYAKEASLIIGRSSGNQSLGCFLPHIPIIELDVPFTASYSACKIHPNVKSYSPNDVLNNPNLIFNNL